MGVYVWCADSCGHLLVQVTPGCRERGWSRALAVRVGGECVRRKMVRDVVGRSWEGGAHHDPLVGLADLEGLRVVGIVVLRRSAEALESRLSTLHETARKTGECARGAAQNKQVRGGSMAKAPIANEPRRKELTGEEVVMGTIQEYTRRRERGWERRWDAAGSDGKGQGRGRDESRE